MKLVLACLLLSAVIVVVGAAKCYQCGKDTRKSCQNPITKQCPIEEQSCYTEYYEDGPIRFKDCFYDDNNTPATHKPDECKDITVGKNKHKVCYCTGELCNDQSDDKSGSAKLGGLGLLIVLMSIIGMISKS